ncbi:hypothetical protein EDB84DRAFT_984607 [Lactarius hengduanensis]|nr:hypothetical protein EDB84DRAFT_984607 [Lactarius hengduanensis]
MIFNCDVLFFCFFFGSNCDVLLPVVRPVLPLQRTISYRPWPPPVDRDVCFGFVVMPPIKRGANTCRANKGCSKGCSGRFRQCLPWQIMNIYGIGENCASDSVLLPCNCSALLPFVLSGPVLPFH